MIPKKPEFESSAGAIALSEGHGFFRVWAPNATVVEVHLLNQNRYVALASAQGSYHQQIIEGVSIGDLYLYRLDGTGEFPDPASRLQPHGVHGPSQVINPDFPWTDHGWGGIPQEQYILYELHVGTFTSEGTFDAIIPRLPVLMELGITAIELMPIIECPGKWNWGYDGVDLFAAKATYGGPDGLRRLVDACHRHKMAVVLDIVYNHIGPEGNYLAEFGPYFSQRYSTDWGPTFNLDGAYSDSARDFLLANTFYWLHDCHIDGFRLDAVDTILDMSAWPFLEQLSTTVKAYAGQMNRHIVLMAEDNSNNSRFTALVEEGGVGLDARWVGDFHHAIHTFLGSNQAVSRIDFGRFDQVVQAYRHGLVFTGVYSKRLKRRRGTPNRIVPAHKIIVFSQNHDQVGNTETGNRSSRLLSFEQLKLLAGWVILSPYLPLLFMGEEYGEPAPFYFFATYSLPNYSATVATSRRKQRALQAEVPDPHEEVAFRRSCLNYVLAGRDHHRVLFEFHKTLIHLRKTTLALAHLAKDQMEIFSINNEAVVACHRWHEYSHVFTIFSLSNSSKTVMFTLPRGTWRKLIASTDSRWAHPDSPGDHANMLPSFDSGGRVKITVYPYSVASYVRVD